MTRIQIYLLGSPEVWHDQAPVLIPRRQNRALLYYLAAHSEPVPRERIQGLFWPDQARPTAQRNLRSALYGLRQVLGDHLQSDEGSLSLSQSVAVDVRQFEHELTAFVTEVAPLSRVLERYRGDFLQDVSLPDNAELEDWILATRERYRRMAVRGLTLLSRLQEAQQAYRPALEALERALTFDPLQEDLQRHCLRLHYLAGDRAGAIRRYERLRRLLDDEMGVPPMAETQAMYDAIITDDAAFWQQFAAAPSPSGLHPPVHASTPFQPENRPLDSEPPFVGRAAELARLHQHSQQGGLVLLEGEAGIGKSRLLQEFLRQVHHTRKGVQVLAGQARELEHGLPYQPLIEALRALLKRAPAAGWLPQLQLPPIWLAETTRLLPELAAHLPARPPIVSTADESRLWEGVHQFLRALARQMPLLLTIDDLHWADSATIGLLGYLIRQLSDTDIAFVAATRPLRPRAAPAVLITNLERAALVQRLPLHRLSETDVHVLARQRHPEQAAALAAWLTRWSEGNPLVLTELLRQLDQQGMIGTLDLNQPPPVPTTVYSLIQSRLLSLSEPARRVLDAAVAMGREFEFDVVARAAALSDRAALDALAELQQARLVLPLDGMRYTFDHQLTMEVAYQDMGDPRHRLLHRHVAEALETVYRGRLEGVVGLIAQHFSEGNAPDRAAPYALRAAAAAVNLAAWQEAIAFYEQARDGFTVEANPVEFLQAQVGLGKACLLAGNATRASEVLSPALDLARQLGHEDELRNAQMSLGQALLMQARYEDVLALADRVEGVPLPEAGITADYLRGLALSQEGAALPAAAFHLERALTHLTALDNPRPLSSDDITPALITFELGNVAAQQGDLATAVTHYQTTRRNSRPLPGDANLRVHILAYNNLAYHLHLLKDPQARSYAEQGLTLAHENGALPVLTYFHSTLGEIELATGNLVAAETQFQAGLALAERFAVPERIAGLTANLGRVAAAHGEQSLAVHHLSTALTRAEALGIRHLSLRIRLWLAPLLPPDAARSTLAEARRIAADGHHHRLLKEIEALSATLDVP